ncbi:hypothetical protein BDV26DRAFT_286351 [Aspergillus bertholletiae]|uniref:Uncharacterized protein n=1 Tax=Aspergillus bertholletiae TaxID=1226010 RepID=A0A5N7ASF8_9EURO|nr:hypothetical protein BDV26DRAFT_286351 [Aspergillus bertholletiae]
MMPDICKRARRKIHIQEYISQIFIVTANGFGIFATWRFPQYWYLTFPFLSVAVIMNIAMICCPEKPLVPDSPENLVFLIPYDNKTKNKTERSLNSLITQKGISEHQHCPGIKKTTGEYLFKDILTQKNYRIQVPRAYLAWDQQFMNIEQYQGKQDSLIAVRSFLYNYNIRYLYPKTIFNLTFFSHLAFFITEPRINSINYLIGIDTDTSIITYKVSYFPGYCQLLKIYKEIYRSKVLIERFGYYPIPIDRILRRIRATISEDHNSFLSQRRRWTLGATSNDLILSFAPGVQCMGRFVLAMFLWIIFCFIAIVLIPIVYYTMIPFWPLKKWHDNARFWVGCLMYIVCGPFINVAILFYSCHYVDSFGWGKTQQVVSEDRGDGAGPATEETPRLVPTK